MLGQTLPRQLYTSCSKRCGFVYQSVRCNLTPRKSWRRVCSVANPCLISKIFTRLGLIIQIEFSDDICAANSISRRLMRCLTVPWGSLELSHSNPFAKTVHLNHDVCVHKRVLQGTDGVSGLKVHYAAPKGF